MAATGSAFVIRETTGPDKRTVRLSGRAMPYRPYTLVGKHRFDLTWYAGSPEGTIQLQGAKEEPTSIRGWWKDRFIRQVASLNSAELDDNGFLPAASGQTAAGQAGEPPAQVDGESVLNVADLADVIDDIRVKGQILEVSVNDKVRFGILEAFTQNWHTQQDLEYEINFVWVAREFRLAEFQSITTRQLDQSDSIAELNNQIEKVSDVFGSGTTNPQIPEGGLNIDLAGTEVFQAISNINDQITDIKRAIVGLENTVITNVATINGAISTAQRAAGIYNFMKRAANNILNELSGVFEAFALNTVSEWGDRISRRDSIREQREAVAIILGVAAIRQEQMEKQLNPALIRSFVARDDQDLRNVSTEFYGTPDNWRGLMLFNELSSSRLVANQLVFVPRDPPPSNEC